MANIKRFLDNIKQAIYGEEVRSSIHDGIEAINKEVVDTTGKQDKLEKTFKDLIINAGNSNAELVEAREGEKTLKENLNKNYLKSDQLEPQWENIKIDNIETLNSTLKGGVATDVIVKGRTLVNLASKNSKNIIIDKNIDSKGRVVSVSLSQFMKADTAYTAITKFSGDILKHGVRGLFMVDGKEAQYSGLVNPNEYYGVKKINLKNDSNVLGIYLEQEDFDNGKKVTIEYVMILEGDYTLNPPNYFEGIKSIGEVNYIDGKYIGKNLLDLKYLSNNVSYVFRTSHNFSNNTLVVKSIQADTWGHVGFKLPPLKPNTNYTIQRKFNTNIITTGAGKVRIYKNNDPNHVVVETTENIPLTFNTTSNYNNLYILFYSKTDSDNLNTVTFYDMQLEEGLKTDYEPYYEGSKIEILSTGKNLIGAFSSLDSIRLRHSFNNGDLELGIEDDKATWSNVKFQYSNIEPYTDYIVSYTDVIGDSDSVVVGLKSVIGNSEVRNLGDVTLTEKQKVIRLQEGEKLNVRCYANTLTPKSIGYKRIIKGLKIEKGNISTSYEPYKSNKTEILLKEPLRSVGSISDVLIEGTLTRNLRQIVVNDETCNFSIWTQETGYDCLLIIPKVAKKKMNYNGLLESFSQINNTIGGYWVNSDNTVVAFPKGTKIEDMKKAVFGKNFIYQLESPTIEQIDNPLVIRIFKEGYISFLNTVAPRTIEFKLNTTVASQIDVISEGIKGFDNKVDKVERNIIEVNYNISSINGDISNLKTKADYSEKQIKDALEGNSNLKDRINTPIWDKITRIDSADLNEVVKTGIYMGYDMKNSPVPKGTWAYVEIMQHNNSWILQRIIPFGTNELIQRQKINGSWSNWQFIAGNMTLEKFDNGDTIVQRLPGGLISISGWHHQSDSNGRGVYFPVAFPNKIVSIVATGVYIAGNNRTGDSITVFNMSNTGFSFNFGYGSTNTRANWIATGY